MLPRSIRGQQFFSRSSWGDVMDDIKEGWDNGFFITDFDYGDGVYFVVMSKVEEWNGQAVRYASEFPTDDIKELWGKRYSITNMLYDGSDWIVVMTGVDYCLKQKMFRCMDADDFKERVSNGWNEDKIITKLCCRQEYYGNTYVGVMTEYRDSSPSQSRSFLRGVVLASELMDLCRDGKYITNIFDFGGGVMVATESGTEWRSCKIYRCGSTGTLAESIRECWDSGYSVTTLAYYDGEWFAVFGRTY